MKKTTTADSFPALADRVAADVIDHYSTSFSLATRLLAPAVRRDVRNLYAVVRIADEIVDGAARDAGADADEVHRLLDDYERDVLAAPDMPFHTDPVLHAWASTARRCSIDPAHLRAFFASMRTDLRRDVHDADSLARYIHGSAEVIGLMCLDIFLAGQDSSVSADAARTDRAWLADGAAALGAAFQKLNFLRDLGEDRADLGRVYLPELQDGPLTTAGRDRLLDEIDAGIDAGRRRVPALPAGCRAGVAAAAAVYAELSARLRRTPPEQLRRARVSVPLPVKLLAVTRAVAGVRR